MVPGVNPIQLDVQNPNLRSKSLENLGKTNSFRDELFKETNLFNDYFFLGVFFCVPDLEVQVPLAEQSSVRVAHSSTSTQMIPSPS